MTRGLLGVCLVVAIGVACLAGCSDPNQSANDTGPAATTGGGSGVATQGVGGGGATGANASQGGGPSNGNGTARVPYGN